MFKSCRNDLPNHLLTHNSYKWIKNSILLVPHCIGILNETLSCITAKIDWRPIFFICPCICVYHYICLCQDWLEVRALYLSLYLYVSLYLSLYLCIYLCQDWLGRRASLLSFSDFDCWAHFFVRGLMGGDYPLLGDAGWAHKTLHYALCTMYYALCTMHYVLRTRGRWLGPKDPVTLWWWCTVSRLLAKRPDTESWQFSNNLMRACTSLISAPPPYSGLHLESAPRILNPP